MGHLQSKGDGEPAVSERVGLLVPFRLTSVHFKKQIYFFCTHRGKHSVAQTDKTFPLLLLKVTSLVALCLCHFLSNSGSKRNAMLRSIRNSVVMPTSHPLISCFPTRFLKQGCKLEAQPTGFLLPPDGFSCSSHTAPLQTTFQTKILHKSLMPNNSCTPIVSCSRLLSPQTAADGGLGIYCSSHFLPPFLCLPVRKRSRELT